MFSSCPITARCIQNQREELEVSWGPLRASPVKLSLRLNIFIQHSRAKLSGVQKDIGSVQFSPSGWSSLTPPRTPPVRKALYSLWA